MIKAVLNNEILNYIISIERSNEHFSNVRIPVEVFKRLRKNSRKKSSYASNKIEGNPLNEQQANSAIEDRSRHLLKPEQEIRNYYLAMEYLDSKLKNKEKLSLDLILDVQKRIVYSSSKEKIGIRSPMPPGFLFAVYDESSKEPEYIPPAAEDIEPLLDELIGYVNESEDHPLLKAAIVHYQLVTIHPFEDGNGRTARLISEYVLDYYGYYFGGIGSLEEYFLYNLQEYYDSLQMGLPALYYDGRNNPPHPEIWIEFFLRMVKLYSEKNIEMINRDISRSTETSLSHLNKKEKAFYYYLRDNNIEKFTPIELSETFSVSNRTIINWCSALCKNGLLKAELVNKRIRSYIFSKDEH